MGVANVYLLLFLNLKLQIFLLIVNFVYYAYVDKNKF